MSRSKRPSFELPVQSCGSMALRYILLQGVIDSIVDGGLSQACAARAASRYSHDPPAKLIERKKGSQCRKSCGISTRIRPPTGNS
jgi:hypothetical protein